MACLECGLEQAVAGGGTCARCGAPLPGAEHPSGTFTGPGGAELRVDGSGITVRRNRKARARLLSWDEIAWFRDGWGPVEGNPGWMLDIVLTSSRGERAAEAWAAGREQAPPELLALIRQAAAVHALPAVLTGGQVHDGLPGKNAGLYYDPAGEPGLREWTGTEWSPFLQVDPATSGHPGEGTGLARIWSPLSPEELHRQADAILQYGRDIQVAILVLMVGLGLACAGIAVYAWLHTPPEAWKAAGFGALAILLLLVGGLSMRHPRSASPWHSAPPPPEHPRKTTRPPQANRLTCALIEPSRASAVLREWPDFGLTRSLNSDKGRKLLSKSPQVSQRLCWSRPEAKLSTDQKAGI